MLRAVYKSGSSLILDKPHDIDYINYYDTKEERHDALIHSCNRSVDNHFVLWEHRARIFIGCYIYPFMEYVSGEKIDEFENFNICDHKAEYKEIAEKYIGFLEKESKIWYHIYIACMMFENGKNEINEEQKAKAQKVHDKGITEQQISFIKRVLSE